MILPALGKECLTLLRGTVRATDKETMRAMSKNTRMLNVTQKLPPNVEKIGLFKADTTYWPYSL